MVSHARIHTRHRSWHSHIPQYHSLPENEDNINVVQSPTLPNPESQVEVARRAVTSHVDSPTGGINATIPIAVGICVPLVVIIVTFLWLHRRHVNKMRAEERSDPHKSLDFGLGNKSSSAKTGREMGQIEFEKSVRNGRGLSMDIGSPYLLPPEVQNSRESLSSISRNMIHEDHDPYRPAFFSSASSSARNSTAHDDNASIKTGSTRGYRQEAMHSPLVHNAQRMPFSSSPSSLQSIGEQPRSDSRSQSKSPLALPPPVEDSQPNMDNFVPPPPTAHIPGSQQRKNTTSPPPIAMPQEPQRLQSPPIPSHAQASPLPQITVGNTGQDYDYVDEYIQQPMPQRSGMASPNSAVSEQFYTPTAEFHEPMAQHPQDGLGVQGMEFDNRRLSVLRPLPPDDPNDTPQQRALRIRSFYKEYFNDNDTRVYQQGPNEYYEDYGSEYLGDGAVYDPTTGEFVVGGAPFAEPITRRAMTPPPRGPPRFAGNSRHTSTNSSPYINGRARAFSTASAGPVRGRQPKRNAPLPGPLRTLPTPHLLKEDAFSLPIDFAPPTKIRDQATGRSASPRPEARPFSPSVAIASPLQSSFNELPAMPSPHHLRKSGTFTALDFAPPPRFRDRDNASDAGSIRSGRSNHSTSSRMQVQNIRAGAYRLSRIPKELVATQNDFQDILKPTWKVGS